MISLDQSNKSKKSALNITRLSNSSWFRIDYEGKIFHFDPGFVGAFEDQKIPLSKLEEKADFIFISHCHFDHYRPEAIEKILSGDTIVIAPPCMHEQSNLLFQSVRANEELSINDISIRVVDAYNTEEGHSTRKFHHKGEFVGYLVRFGKMILYFAGDTDCIPEMKSFGPVDIALLPIGGTYVMDLDEAAEAVNIIQPKIAIPMHQSQTDPSEFKTRIEKNSISKALLLHVGDQQVVSI